MFADGRFAGEGLLRRTHGGEVSYVPFALDGGTTEREFDLDGIPAILWTPSTASPAAPAPLILLGQPGGMGMRRMHPRLAARARAAAAQGFASVAIEPPV